MRVPPLFALTLHLASAPPVMAQAPLPSASTADSVWTLLRDLPADTRVQVRNGANESATATVARLDPDRVTLTGAHLEGKTWGGSTLTPASIIVKPDTLAGLNVVRMARKYTADPAQPRPRAARHVVASLAPGHKVRVNTADGATIDGRIASVDDATLTLTADGAPLSVPFSNMTRIEAVSSWKKGYTIAIIGAAVFLALLGYAASQAS